MKLNDAIERIYETFDGSREAQNYHDRHGIESLGVLTVGSVSEAKDACAPFVDAIRGKTVVEIGAGVGLLSMEIALHAAKVFAIEADPAWTFAYIGFLHRQKPKNLTWIFGSADEVADTIRADVAVIRTRSGVRSMVALGERMAETIVLSTCEIPLVLPRGHSYLRHISNYIDEQVEKLLKEAAVALGTQPLSPTA